MRVTSDPETDTSMRGQMFCDGLKSLKAFISRKTAADTVGEDCKGEEEGVVQRVHHHDDEVDPCYSFDGVQAQVRRTKERLETSLTHSSPSNTWRIAPTRCGWT